MQTAPLDVQVPVMMAPMVGLSHIVLRKLVKSYIPAPYKTIWPTEMLNSRKIPCEKLGQTFSTLKDPEEKDLHPQILGNLKDEIEASIIKLKEWGAVGIDINMGCPVKKALQHNYGVALMGDAEYAKQVAQFAVESSDLPVSVKLRAGFQNDKNFLLNFVKGLEEVGVSWICLHPRYADQKRRGRADWQQIKFIKRELKIPVIGNGDIQVASDAIRMLEQTQCDGVMIGRALTVRPWMLAQVASQLMSSSMGPKYEGPSSPEEEATEYGKSLIMYLNICENYFPVEFGIKRFKFHVKNGIPWLNFGLDLFSRIHNIENYSEAKEVVTTFFKSQNLKLSSQTTLNY